MGDANIRLEDMDNWYERLTMARQGIDLDKFIDDENDDVREAVARQGYGLDKLVNDAKWNVSSVAKRQIENNLDKFINDKIRDIIIAIVEGRNGENWYTRSIAKQKLAKLNSTESSPI